MRNNVRVCMRNAIREFDVILADCDYNPWFVMRAIDEALDRGIISEVCAYSLIDKLTKYF